MCAVRRWVLAAALLLGCARACFVLKRGVQQGKLIRSYAMLEAGQAQAAADIFPRGTGVTLGGVSVEVCGARAGAVALRVQYPRLLGTRLRGHQRVTLQLDAYVVPYSVGYHALTDGDLTV